MVKKRFYSENERVWVVQEKTDGIVKSIDKEKTEMTVEFKDVDGKWKEVTRKLWEFNKFHKKEEHTLYLASVKGGVIPSKDVENGGYDCFARLEPTEIDGKQVYELHIPQFTMAKIPLGFASYLDKTDILSLKHERGSVGGTGLINLSGLIDSTYQGEVIMQCVPLIADIVISSEVEEKYFDEETNTFFLPYKNAITQAVILTQSKALKEVIPYEELLNKPSTRGTQGWGSTDRK